MYGYLRRCRDDGRVYIRFVRYSNEAKIIVFISSTVTNPWRTPFSNEPPPNPCHANDNWFRIRSRRGLSTFSVTSRSDASAGTVSYAFRETTRRLHFGRKSRIRLRAVFETKRSWFTEPAAHENTLAVAFILRARYKLPPVPTDDRDDDETFMFVGDAATFWSVSPINSLNFMRVGGMPQLISRYYVFVWFIASCSLRELFDFLSSRVMAASVCTFVWNPHTRPNHRVGNTSKP